ncbi:hypothetical protein ACKFKF_10750 [Phormidesmis sp. 146-12]
MIKFPFDSQHLERGNVCEAGDRPDSHSSYPIALLAKQFFGEQKENYDKYNPCQN